jgi:uncharacterized protein YfiM (DUF2279 family)
MKMTIFFLFLLSFGLLFADNTKQDTTVTRIMPKDVMYYDIVNGNDKDITGDQTYRDFRSDKPFALRQPTDRWFSHDKWMHLTTSYFLTVQASYALDKMFMFPQESSRNISIGLTVSLALGKELYDVYGNNGIFSWKDLVYDLLGTGLGYLTLNALHK